MASKPMNIRSMAQKLFAGIVALRSLVSARTLFSIDVLDLPGVFILGSTLALPVALSAGIGFYLPALAILLLLLLTGVIYGSALLAAGGIIPSSGGRAPLTLGLGLLSTALLLLAISLIFGVSVGPAFTVVAAGAVLLAILFADGERGDLRQATRNWGFIAAICALSVVWAWQAIMSVPTLEETSTLTAWVDFVFHAAMVSQFAQFSDFGGSFIFAHGAQLPVYHYGSYMLPAVLKAATAAPAIAVATSFGPTLSFVIMGLAIWALGDTLQGGAGAAAALGAVFLLPSAALYGFSNPYFDLHWLLQVTSTAQAVGLCVLAIALALFAVRHASLRAGVIAAALALSVVMFRAQMLPMMGLACLGLLLLCWRFRYRWMPWAILVAFIAVGGIGLATIHLVPRAPALLQEAWDPLRTLATLLPRDRLIVHGRPNLVAVPVLLGVLLLSAFGALLPAYAIGAAWCRARTLGRRFDFLPALFVLAYSAVVLTFPIAKDDEFQHRPFPLVYVVLAVWVACMLVRLLGEGDRRWTRRILLALGLLLLPFPLVMQRSAQTGRAEWMTQVNHVDIPRGLLRAAEFVRGKAAPSDIVVGSDTDRDWPYTGYLTALSERSTYVMLLKSNRAWELWGVPVDMIARRTAVVDQLRQATTIESLYRTAQNAGIGWFVLSPTHQLPDGVLAHASFSADGYAVFAIPSHGAPQ